MEAVGMGRLKRVIISFLLGSLFAVGSLAVLGVPNTAVAQTSQPVTKEACEAKSGNWTIVDANNTYKCVGGSLDNTKQGDLLNIDGWFYRNVWLPLMQWLGSLFLTLGAGLLQMAGYLFNEIVRMVVIAYGETLRNIGAMDMITTGWTVFRDFANILVIGFFVYIAITIILGLNEFGQKKLVANVIIIAVLMNFSLLFTKLIIDGSNFVAFQIYKQMSGVENTSSNTFGLAESFLAPMGIGSIWETDKVINENANDNAMKGFTFGLIGGILLFLVAAILFYGCFLVAWRGILFIVLMLTAPLAFATYLMPSFAKGEFGWDNWWKQLINNAMFGPLLMIMLAISLAIVNAAGENRTVPLGHILSDPSKAEPNAWATILIYVIGAGLLFVSMRLASKFAGSIGGGFSFAKVLALTPIAAAGATGGGAMRRVFGGSAALRALELEEKIKAQRDAVRMAPNDSMRFKENQKLLSMMKQQSKAEERAKRPYNFDNTTLGKYLQKQGMPALSGDTKGGYLEPRKKAAEEAAKEGAKLSVDNKQAEELARTQIRENRQIAQEQIDTARESATQVVEAARNMAESQKRTEQLAEKQVEAERNRDILIQKKASIEQEANAPGISSQLRAEKQRALAEQEERIKSADAEVRGIKQRVQAVDSAHLDQPKVREAKLTLGADDVKVLSRVILNNSKQAAEDLAALQVAKKDHFTDAYTTQYVREQTKKAIGNKRISERIKAEKEIAKEFDGDSAPAAPGTPPSTT